MLDAFPLCSDLSFEKKFTARSTSHTNPLIKLPFLQPKPQLQDHQALHQQFCKHNNLHVQCWASSSGQLAVTSKADLEPLESAGRLWRLTELPNGTEVRLRILGQLGNGGMILRKCKPQGRRVRFVSYLQQGGFGLPSFCHQCHQEQQPHQHELSCRVLPSLQAWAWPQLHGHSPCRLVSVLPLSAWASLQGPDLKPRSPWSFLCLVLPWLLLQGPGSNYCRSKLLAAANSAAPKVINACCSCCCTS